MSLASNTSTRSAAPELVKGLGLLEAARAALGAASVRPLPQHPCPAPAALFALLHPICTSLPLREATRAAAADCCHGSRSPRAGQEAELTRLAEQQLLPPPPARHRPLSIPAAALPSHTHRGGSFRSGYGASAPHAAVRRKFGGGDGLCMLVGRDRTGQDGAGRGEPAPPPGEGLGRGGRLAPQPQRRTDGREGGTRLRPLGDGQGKRCCGTQCQLRLTPEAAAEALPA